MNSETPLQARPTGTSALRLAARRSVARVMRRAVYMVLALAGGAGLVVTALSPASWQSSAAVAAAILVVGGAAGLAFAHSLAGVISRVATRPLEMLLAQPGMVRESDEDIFHWEAGVALNRSEIEADLALLSRHLRAASRRSREAVRELESAREQATQQNIAKSQFVAKMSHELRTPLNAILGYAMLLQEDATLGANASALADLERIQVAGRSLLATINDILDLAKLEAGNAVLQEEVINLGEATKSAVEACPAEQRNGSRLEVTISDDIGMMVGDSGKVRQCLAHLLSNAFKFTRDGNIELTVSPTVRGKIPFVTFTVRDTGIGIDASNLERVFDEFGQTDAGRIHDSRGLGLGLAITRRLARLMGGDCTAESLEGEGSTFYLSLPLNPSGDAQAEQPRPPLPESSVPVRRSVLSVLIVEDDEATTNLMQRWFERMGYDVFTAPDGESGLAMAFEHRPDLIILDAFLPGMSGYEVLTQWRADPALSRTPVILVTVDDDRARALSAGASEYLRKPVTAAQLRAVSSIYREKVGGEVLVIDDDDDAAELIKRGLEQAGFSTRRASDGQEGMNMALQATPAAIVLDLTMPVLDGFGVIQQLSDHDALMNIPLIVVSGRNINLSQHQALAARRHRFFRKGTATPREIAQSLQELVA
jgi:signal transduction histidine kinase/DNA-binding response OmpR family regulator